MGNVCSSGQKKKDTDNASEKSEDSPSYQLAEKKDRKQSKQAIVDGKEAAPLADPEPISDVSTGQNTTLTTNSPTNGNLPKGAAIRTQQNIQTASNISDSVSSTPQTVNAPCELPTIAALPQSLQSLQGKPITGRRTEKDKKIILYVLAADVGHKVEKSVLHGIYESLKERCACKGFEILISDSHATKTDDYSEMKVLDFRKWSNSPLEAQGGHEEAANCLAEISRHSNSSYIIPVLILGTSLGTPLLPLTIESQDFTSALNSVENVGKLLLEKWYVLDNTSQPPCYRLKTKDVKVANVDDANVDLNNLLTTLVDLFSKELRDSYLTTVVEQEINNTVLISQELSKRCIWIQTGSLPPKLPENPTSLELEMNRRLNNIHQDLKNQLSEKNLIRIPPSIQVQEEQLAAIMESLITTVIDGIADEHANKFSIPNCTFGVDKRLLGEVEAVSQHSKLLGQNCANFSIMDKLKSYLTGNSASPLIVYGPSGSGKSVLAAKIMHNAHAWIPECSLILRYAKLTEISSHLISLLGSIAEQLSFLANGKPCRISHTLESYTKFIKTTLETTKQYIVIVIDSVDQLNGLETISWLPVQLSLNIKIILTVSINPNEDNQQKKGNWFVQNLKKAAIPEENFIELTKFSDEQWRDVLSFGGGDFYAANGALQLPESWRNANEKIPLQAKILWWLAWLGNCNIPDTKMSTIINKVFETIEGKFTSDVIGFFLPILAASRNGIAESDLIALLKESQIVKDCAPSLIWLRFCWLMGPMLLHSDQISIMDKKVQQAAYQRYGSKINEAHRTLCEYYRKQNLFLSDKKGKYKCFNAQKLIQLPYYAFMLDNHQQKTQLFARSMYLSDLEWIHDKLVAIGCVPILNDIFLIEDYLRTNGKQLNDEKHLCLLKTFIEIHIRELNYDGNQFYSLLYSYLQDELKRDLALEKHDIIQKWNDCLKTIKSTYLERLNEFIVEEKDDSKPPVGFDLIMNLDGKGYFVASISTTREEICVWDVSACKKVRTLSGVPHPTSLCPVGEYGVAVLCKREIKMIDLNEGKFKVTLKGVMNQKMPYFGLHDSTHLVCLSRNRMYVNLMNLESGDCVTTFKAGEDRFLNSLLVSGDGRILVCGDETQKPFPLLVWHLSQRKLLYDLRIPHHDFITSLSAITHEGSYVCVVAKELNEPTPNFIVVYDLQSGTLFKKWKPSCNTVSLAISQTNACVIAGLEDARILIWDLVTGNCRCTLSGHNAPVTLLRLDPLGKILLSGDKDGRDTSIRLWELDSGKSLAVYTPPAQISACEILPNGKYVVLALENHSNLITLILRNYEISDGKENSIEQNIYGLPENDGKSFDLK